MSEPDPKKKIEELIVKNFNLSLSDIPLPQQKLIPIVPGIGDGLLLGTEEANEHCFLVQGDIDNFFKNAPLGYFVIGFWGHGFNSYAFYYSKVDPKSKILFRLPFGGVYMDNEKEARRIKNYLTSFFKFKRQLENFKSLNIFESMGECYYDILFENYRFNSRESLYYLENAESEFSKILKKARMKDPS